MDGFIENDKNLVFFKKIYLNLCLECKKIIFCLRLKWEKFLIKMVKKVIFFGVVYKCIYIVFFDGI